MKRALFATAAGLLLLGGALAAHRAARPVPWRRPGFTRPRVGAPVRRDGAWAAARHASSGRSSPHRGAHDDLVHWAEEDPASALDWLASLPDGDKKTRGIATVGLTLAPRDLEAAVELTQVLPWGASRRWLTAGITRIWSKSDPEAAAAWLAPIPEGLERNQCLSILAGTWAGTDPAAAERWLDTLPPGESWDAAAAAFAGATGENLAGR